MTKEYWFEKIKADTEKAGTYKPCFDSPIETLAGILEQRDAAQETFEKTGGNVIIKHTNKAGATNLSQHPALRLVNDLNRDALAYWRDLGLTPRGLKAINDEAMKQKENDSFITALEKLGV